MDAAKADRLFLERGCPHCGSIRGVLSMQAAVDDKFVGTAGQSLRVFATLSNNATIELLDKFGYAGQGTPLLVTHSDEVITKPAAIIDYLQKNGMSTK